VAEFRDDRITGRRTVTIGSDVDGAFLFLTGNTVHCTITLRHSTIVSGTSGFPGSVFLSPGSTTWNRHRSAADRAIVTKLGTIVETGDLYDLAEFDDDRSTGGGTGAIRSR
jgi:hypothetical protein